VLSYAAYLQGLTPEGLESEVLGQHLHKRGTASIVAAVEAADQQGAFDPQAFTDSLASSLADGGFRLVFVLDSTPDELVQLVGYLQLLTDRIVVDLVTVSTYEVNGARILVPQHIEPARRSAEPSDAEAVARQVNALHPGAEAAERTAQQQRAQQDANQQDDAQDSPGNCYPAGCVPPVDPELPDAPENAFCAARRLA